MLSFLPMLHSLEEDVRFVRTVMLATQTVTVAAVGDRIVGFLARDGGMITQLYVHPDFTGRGVGTHLLNLAKAARPALELWTFVQNDGARRFYERHGFRAVEFGDGSGNEERLPDVRYGWRR